VGIYFIIPFFGGHSFASRKVVGSLQFFNLPNVSSSAVALGFTHPLTEMTARDIPGEESAAVM
jgi:hypothetical protein